jgi:hypothetical protein
MLAGSQGRGYLAAGRPPGRANRDLGVQRDFAPTAIRAASTAASASAADIAAEPYTCHSRAAFPCIIIVYGPTSVPSLGVHPTV